MVALMLVVVDANDILGVPEKERKQTKTSGRFPDLKNFSGTIVLMIRDSV
jgi:hypothetical protein